MYCIVATFCIVLVLFCIGLHCTAPYPYLSEGSSFVKIDSSIVILTFHHHTQGHVLGSPLVVLFVSPIANIIKSDQTNQNNIVSFHQYADDTQLYIGTNSSKLTSQIASVESCTQRVRDLFL